jgi:hypothetical protein
MRIPDLISKLNSPGIKLPFINDPKTKQPSVSLTMLFISFNVVLIGLIGKWSKIAEGVDLPQAINWFLICAGLYFGRKMSDVPKND